MLADNGFGDSLWSRGAEVCEGVSVPGGSFFVSVGSPWMGCWLGCEVDLWILRTGKAQEALLFEFGLVWVKWKE